MLWLNLNPMGVWPWMFSQTEHSLMSKNIVATTSQMFRYWKYAPWYLPEYWGYGSGKNFLKISGWQSILPFAVSTSADTSSFCGRSLVKSITGFGEARFTFAISPLSIPFWVARSLCQHFALIRTPKMRLALHTSLKAVFPRIFSNFYHQFGLAFQALHSSIKVFFRNSFAYWAKHDPPNDWLKRTAWNVGFWAFWFVQCLLLSGKKYLPFRVL